MTDVQSISGEAGNDLIFGYGGGDSVYGEDGWDWIDVLYTDGELRDHAETAGDGFEVILQSNGSDVPVEDCSEYEITFDTPAKHIGTTRIGSVNSRWLPMGATVLPGWQCPVRSNVSRPA